MDFGRAVAPMLIGTKKSKQKKRDGFVKGLTGRGSTHTGEGIDRHLEGVLSTMNAMSDRTRRLYPAEMSAAVQNMHVDAVWVEWDLLLMVFEV